MKVRIIFLVVFFVAAGTKNLSASLEISFSFTATHSCTYAASDSIIIENLTQGGDTVLYWNDTVLSFIFTGSFDLVSSDKRFRIKQNYPNPYKAETNINVFMPVEERFTVRVIDLRGRLIDTYSAYGQKGANKFKFDGHCSNAYIFSFESDSYRNQILMLRLGGTSEISSGKIEYLGGEETLLENAPELRTMPQRNYFPYYVGDELKFTCFVNGDYKVITDAPWYSKEYVFHIKDGVPEPPSEILGSTLVCANETNLVYEVEFVQGVSYQWSLPSGWEIIQGQGTHSIVVNAGSGSEAFYVIAENNCGSSYPSELSVSVVSEAPDAPNALDATEIGEAQFTAHWEPVENISHYTIDIAYDIEFNTFVGSYHNLNVGTAVEYSITGLDPDTDYYFRVYAVNACGSSQSSNIKSAATLESGSECPDLSVGDLFGGGVVVSTDYPNSPCGYLIVTNFDQTQGAVWADCSSWNQNTYSLSNAIGEGQNNTNWIVANCSNSAAALCDNFSHEGFSDWFLPSANELSGPIYSNSNYAGFTGVNYYWSSSGSVQWGSFMSTAVTIDPSFNSSGSQSVQSGTFPVRCVRAF